MNSIKIWYNKHRKKMWTIIGILVIMFLVVQLIRIVYGLYRDYERSTYTNSTITMSEEINNSLNSISLETGESVVTGQALSNAQQGGIEAIDSFVEYCNSGNIEEAYNMLSDECKDEMYPRTRRFYSGLL